MREGNIERYGQTQNGKSKQKSEPAFRKESRLLIIIGTYQTPMLRCNGSLNSQSSFSINTPLDILQAEAMFFPRVPLLVILCIGILDFIEQQIVKEHIFDFLANFQQV